MPSKFNPDKFDGKVSHLFEKEDYTGALKLLETLPPAHKKKNEYHFAKSLCYYHLDEDKKVLTHLNKISSKFRKDPDYQFLKAECHYSLGRDKDMDPAIQAYSNAIELYESDPKSLEWFIDENIPIFRSNSKENSLKNSRRGLSNQNSSISTVGIRCPEPIVAQLVFAFADRKRWPPDKCQQHL